MRASRMCVVVAVAAAALLAFPALAPAWWPSKVDRATSTFDFSANMRPVGFSSRPVPANNLKPRQGVFNSDLAFWGDTAVQGTYSGFRLIDVSERDDPEEIVNWEDCASPTNTVGNQGDVIVWGDPQDRRRRGPALVIRSWNSPTPAPRDLQTGAEILPGDPRRLTQPAAFCGDHPMFRVPPTPSHPVNPPAVDRGQEGVHVIDVSDPEEPKVVAFVDIPCGSHTETLVPDLKNNRLLIYSNPSANTTFGSPQPGSEPVHCRGLDIVEVPLDDPSQARYVRFLPGGDPEHPPEELHPCHDTGVILGRVMKVACAGGSGPTVFTVDPDEGGALDNPKFLYHADVGTGIGHSASWSWDGEVLVFGHEPGGGSGARCQATSTDLERTLFFLDGDTGEVLSRYLHPRPQTAQENCTWHNYNVVPQRDRNVLVSGNYQSGILVVDFTDPTDPELVAHADPAPLVNPQNPTGIELGGDWSTYWYDGRIYESDISRGMIIWKLRDRAVSDARDLGHLNPQTQEFSIGARKRGDRQADH